jgi:phage terminase small subunit
LTHEQYRFGIEYMANGGNATAAYRAGHPAANAATCAVNGSRMLRNTKVRDYLRTEVESKLAVRKANGDVLIGLVVQDAFADIRDLFDHKGELLKPHDWPLSVALSVESFERRGDGTVRVRLASKFQARRLLLEITGKAKARTETVAEVLAAALRHDQRASANNSPEDFPAG